MNHLKGYRSVAEAMRSKAGQVPGAVIEDDCRICDLVHVRKSAGAPPALRKRKRQSCRDTGAPRAVRDAVFDRDRWCVLCGLALVKGEGGYSIHHLTLRSHGIDNSVEAQILACGSGTTGCHGWIHDHPAVARLGGWIRLGTATAGSGPEPVMVALPTGYGWFVLLPDGTRRAVDAPAAAA